jgi:esterase/lipase superfamily enzyme
MRIFSQLSSLSKSILSLFLCLTIPTGAALSQRPARSPGEITLDQIGSEAVQRQLIVAGLLDADVGLASWADLSCARHRLATGERTQSGCGVLPLEPPLSAAELRWLREVEQAFDSAFGLKFKSLPSIKMRVLVPTAFLDAATSDRRGTNSMDQIAIGDPATLIEYFVFRDLVHNDTPASLFVGNLAAWKDVNAGFTQLTPDEIWAEGDGTSVGRADRHMFRNRTIMGDGNVYGLHLKAPGRLSGAQAKLIIERQPAFSALIKKLGEQPLERANLTLTDKTAALIVKGVRQDDPAAALQAIWEPLIVSLANLVIPQFVNDASGPAFDAAQCTKGEVADQVAVPKGSSASHSAEVVIFGTDRVRTYKRGADGEIEPDLRKVFGTGTSGALSIGCVTVMVPTSPAGRRQQSFVHESNPVNAGGKTYFTGMKLGETAVTWTLDGLRPRMRGHSNLKDLHEGRRALLYVHGFNNSFVDAVGTAALIKAQSKYQGPIFAFSWPSNGSSSPQAYMDDMDRSEQSESYLRAFLVAILRDAEISRLDIVAHSMGSQLVLRVLGSLETLLDRRLQPTESDRFRYGQIVLAEPDVNPLVFQERIRKIAPFATRITVYASSTDVAMTVSKRARGVDGRAGGIGSDDEPIMPGRSPGSGNVHMVDVSNKAMGWVESVKGYAGGELGHNPHLIEPVVVNDIEVILKFPDSTATPDTRNKQIVPVPYKSDRAQTFWRLKR